ncbi:MAG: TonB family protein [Nitrospira sp.]
MNLPVPQLRPTPISRQVQSDYGWLASLVTTEVEQIKRYPAQAKWHRWQGNVIVQAVIHEDGRISHIQVIDSLGHGTLDHDAVALLERISPVQLQYPLNQSSIIVHIPIGYRLE